MANWTRDYVTYNSHQRPIVGDTKISALTTDHIGWLKCDGRALQVADYYFLWRVIGYSFGSNTAADFFLPRPAGRVPGIIGSGTDSNSRSFSHSLGDTVGEEVHVLTIAEMPTHDHGITDPGHRHTYLGIQSQNVGGSTTDAAENDPRPTENTSYASTNITINTSGGSNAHNNLSPIQFIGSLYIYSGRNNVGAWPQALGGNVF